MNTPTRTTIFISLLLFSAIVSSIILHHFYSTRFLPNTSFFDIEISNTILTQAQEQVETQAPNTTITFTTATGSAVLASSGAELGLHLPSDAVLQQVFETTHSNNPFEQFWWIAQSVLQPTVIETSWRFTEEQLRTALNLAAPTVETAGSLPAALLSQSGNESSLEIEPGRYGLQIDTATALQKLQASAAPQDMQFTIPTASTAAELSTEEITRSQARAERLVGSSITLTHLGRDTLVSDQEIISLLALPTGYNKIELQNFWEDWKREHEQKPQDAVFEFDPESLIVENFIPDEPGVSLQTESAIQELTNTLRDLEASPTARPTIVPPVETVQAEKRLAQTNEIGIAERIGRGFSEYDHSIPTRVHNVSLTSDRINNTIVPPGEEFSFNQTLGEVSSKTGFQPAYVIRGGRTELGDGGGVCQVSTTVFRAVLDAGLDITKRLQHSYRVSYYELNAKPGIDATVYAGDVDFRFVNDTDHHILIQSAADPKELEMFVEIYGTSDGRTTEITNHKTWDYRPPPAPQFIPTDTLPTGQRKQIDWAVAGIKASFTNVIRSKDGEILSEETYYSNYRPWSAKYLVGQ